MGSNIGITADIPDLQELSRLLEASFAVIDPDDSSAFSAEQNQGLNEWFSVDGLNQYQQYGKFVTAMENSKMVGVAFVGQQNPIFWPDGHKAELFVLAVLPENRNQGIGSKLLQAAETAASEFGAKSVLINTNSLMQSTINFYVRHGYNVCGELRDFYDNGNATFLMKKL